MAKVRVGDTEFHVEERGGGRPVVLLHGFPLDGRVWEGQLAGLADVARVIVPDQRGFGRTESSSAFTMESLADDLHKLLGELGARPCVLAGLSMGGYVAQAFARKYPGELRGLVLVDTKSESDTAEAKANRGKMIESARSGGSRAVADAMMPKMLAESAHGSRPELVRRLREIMESQRPETLIRALEAMRDRDDFTGDLAKVRVPALIIVGEADAITPPSLAQEMGRKLKSARIEVVAGAGHMAPFEQPERVTMAIRQYLVGLPA